MSKFSETATPRWIWQHPQWPRFTWEADALAPLLRRARLAQGELLGRARGSDAALRAEFSLDALLRNILTSSAIEGERHDGGLAAAGEQAEAGKHFLEVAVECARAFWKHEHGVACRFVRHRIHSTVRPAVIGPLSISRVCGNNSS